jgi:hypothetical protein
MKYKLIYRDDEYAHTLVITSENEEPVIEGVRSLTIGGLILEFDYDVMLVDIITEKEE